MCVGGAEDFVGIDLEGVAFLHSTHLSKSLCSFKLTSTRSTASSVSNVTNPNPRDLPVSRSFIIWQCDTVPYLEKQSLNCSTRVIKKLDLQSSCEEARRQKFSSSCNLPLFVRSRSDLQISGSPPCNLSIFLKSLPFTDFPSNVCGLSTRTLSTDSGFLNVTNPKPRDFPTEISC